MERSHRRRHRKTSKRFRRSGGHYQVDRGGQEGGSVAEQIATALRYRTVDEIAKELEVARPTLSKVINGRAGLSIEMAMKLERRCGLDARRLLHEQLDEQIADYVNQEK
jgi:plasmid maintenance system antidote protein VapI